MDLAMGRTRKRKAEQEAEMNLAFPLDELNQDLLERVLSWLPPSSFFRLRSVCKRWTSISTSASFQIACSEIPFREPWYLMVGEDLNQSIVFDTSEANWKDLNYPMLLSKTHCVNSIPVASSRGLVCYRSPTGSILIICNPVTGACRELTLAGESQTDLRAIAMNSLLGGVSAYRVVIVSGEFSNLAVKVFDSMTGLWEDEVILHREADNSLDSDMAGDDSIYFLSKAGVVVAANTQRSPSKQYSSVLVMENGEEVAYFLSQSGTIVGCNLARKSFFEHPRLLPICAEYSIDVVECNGEMLVVVLSEFLETASLRVWRFCKGEQSWRQVAAMPPAMSHGFFGKRADINCVGCGGEIFICVNSGEVSSYVICNVGVNQWVELPRCFVGGKAMEFMSAFSFEPRVEASV